MTINVLLVEDQALVRASLASLLDSTGLFCVVGAEESVAPALARLDAGEKIDVLLCDYHLRGETAEVLLRQMYRWPEVPVVLLTSSVNAMSLQRCRDMGARGFLFKESGIEEFIRALDAVSRGEEAFSEPDFTVVASVDQPVAARPPIALTDAERLVLSWMVSGMSNKQIALATGKSAETVKTHVASVLRKLGCKTRTQAAAKASYLNLL